MEENNVPKTETVYLPDIEATVNESHNEKKRMSAADKALYIICVLFSSIFLYTAFAGPFISTVQRSICVCGGITIWSLLDLRSESKAKKIDRVLDIFMIAVTTILMVFFVVSGKNILMPQFKMTTPLYILGICFVICVLNAARRTIGWAVPIISLLGLLYALYGRYIPGTFGHPGIKLSRLIETLCYTDHGILGGVTGISATIVSTFIIFGGILFATGGGETFINIASLVAGRFAGGAAKMASVASALFGMISGSSGANVATTGAFTIPLMKRTGYSKEFAAASEAAASSGGQIMPPIMGAGAFIMADLLAVSYKEIAIAAIIPSLLFYIGVMWGIDCYAKRNHIMGIPKESLPKPKEVLVPSKSLPVFLPIGTLIALFCTGFTPVYCASISILVAAVIYLVTDLKDFKKRVFDLINGLAEAAKDMLGVIALVASSEILICMISTTGVGVKFSNIIVRLGGDSMLLAGLCAMVATMILGMGMPTVAAYILAGSVIAPALIMVGVNPMAAHFFVFYYAIFAGLTPPVCGTVFVAAAMADSDWLKTAWISIRLSLGAFLVPFILLFNPGMLLIGSTAEIAQSTLSSLFGIIALGSGAMGFLIKELSWPIRAILVASGFLMIYPGLVTDIIGAVVVAGVIVYLKIITKKVA